MTEFKLECSSAKSKSKDLMTETNSKNWNLSNEFTNRTMRVIQGLGIPWAIGQKDAAWFVAHNLIRRGSCWHDLNAKTMLPKFAEDVVLYSEIKRHDWNLCCRKFFCINHLAIFVTRLLSNVDLTRPPDPRQTARDA